MTKSSDAIINDEGEKVAFVRSLGARDMIVMAQEHGSDVHVIESGERPASGDGLLIVEPGVIGVIKTADCLPVILYAMDEPVAAVVHAGWRGTVKGITEKALRLLLSRGIAPERIGALIGPGIGPCCYNVGEDAASEFRKAHFSEDIFSLRGGSIFLDLKKANRSLIEAAGISGIYDTGLCTACLSGLFHSARRDKGTARQISFVLIQG
jgi:YfiH family protein